MDAYDALPYDRLSVAETHPDHLAALARLYAIDSPPPGRARVLELGCAAGANLLPMAWFMPDARFVGIDLSARQVADGQSRIAALGLRNVELHCADVRDIDPGDDGFDYVIAHGLYSWVPNEVRDALLRLVRRQLRPRGVAYISFNALPGWHLRGMLREMLLFHARSLVAPAERLQAAREFLAFLATGLHGLQVLSAEYLREELQVLQKAPDSYLYHEYLAAVNEPVLFSDFVAAARDAGLRYLCNAELRYQYAEVLGDGAMAATSAITDPLTRQQYLDFLLNRNFHQALLVRDDTPALAEPDHERFATLALFADLAPPRHLELRKARPQVFTDTAGNAHRIAHPLTRAALTYLAMVYPQAVAYPDLEAIAQRQVVSSGDARLAMQNDHLFGELFQLFAHRVVGASVRAGGAIAEPVEPPRATPLAISESTAGRLVDSRHASLSLGAAEAQVIAGLDGSMDRTALAALLRSTGIRGPRSDAATFLRVLQRCGALQR